jgi:HAD superfamily hydrolase (TIGR01509 family)
VKAIIFDFGGVLMRTMNPVPRRALARQLDIPVAEVYGAVFDNPLWDQAQLGRSDVATLWEDVGRRLTLDPETLELFRTSFWAGDRLDQTLVAFIRALGAAGYQTALLSNAPRDLADYLEELEIADAFDVVVISAHVEMVKPRRGIYEEVIRRLDVAPAEAVFVDDQPVNVEAARQVGLHATVFEGLTPLWRWLRSLGVEVERPGLEPLPDVQAVIFDWAGVIEDSPDEAYVRDWEERLGVEPGSLPPVLWGEACRRMERGELTFEQFAAHVGERLGFPDVETAHQFVLDFYDGGWFNPRMERVIEGLNQRYRTALLTNGFPGQDRLIRERFGLDVHEAFDVYVNSAYEGVCKPDPEIFLETLRRLDVEPHRAIFLDDALRNVDAARALDIHTVHVVDADQALQDLASLLGHPLLSAEDA